MNNFREVNENDILKEWLDIREQETFCTMTPKDREHSIYFDEVAENIWGAVADDNEFIIDIFIFLEKCVSLFEIHFFFIFQINNKNRYVHLI